MMSPTGMYQRTEEYRQIMSEAKRGKKLPSWSDERKRRFSVVRKGLKQKPITDEHRRNLSKALEGRELSFEHRRNLSMIKQGVSLDEWNGFVSFEPYCPKFNEKKKEEIRNRYHRTCVISGKSALQLRERLTVHHVDNNKQQGCDGSSWRLVPVTKGWNVRLVKCQSQLLLDLLLIMNKKAEVNYVEN